MTRARRTASAATAAAWIAATAAGCTAITDPGRFDVTGDGRAIDACDGVRRSLLAELVGFEAFAAARIEMFVVTAATGRAEQRAILEGFHPVHDAGGALAEVYAPCMVPARTGMELRLYVDEDGNGGYTPPAGGDRGDLAFVEPIDGDGRVRVEAATSPQADISENLDVAGLGGFTLVVSNMSPHTPGMQRQELHVLDVTDGDTAATRVAVGYHRIGDIDDESYDVLVGGVLVVGRRYRVEFYADLDDDGAYDEEPTDHAWREPTGLRETFPGTLAGELIRFPHRNEFDLLDSFR